MNIKILLVKLKLRDNIVCSTLLLNSTDRKFNYQICGKTIWKVEKLTDYFVDTNCK